MDEEPIDESYFIWLYTKVASVAVPTPSLQYYTLLRDLHSTEFVWLIQGDDNRAQDGLDLRKQFLREAYLKQDPSWLSIPCSVLEMFIAFSNTAAFETDMSARDWFWIFMDNLGLAQLNDAQHNITEYVDAVLQTFVWRTYEYNGTGGMFPIHDPEHDQRKVEIWYQFCEYLVDQDLI